MINRAPNEISISRNKRMKNVINKNKGLKILQNISKIINGEKTEENIYTPEDITTNVIHYLFYSFFGK